MHAIKLLEAFADMLKRVIGAMRFVIARDKGFERVFRRTDR
jgi:hypothetical protein